MVVPKRLIVDACIAFASGSRESSHPTPLNCRKFLESMRELRYYIVFTPALAAEWRKHQKRFASAWRVSMHARKLVYTIDLGPDVNLRRRIAKALAQDEIINIVMKDAHLLEAAFATDNRIVSIETKCFMHLKKIIGDVHELAELALINPDTTIQRAIEWLENGAPVDANTTI